MYALPKTIMFKNMSFNTTWSLACYAVNKYGITVPSGPNYTDNPEYIPPNIKEITGVIEYGEDAINEILNKKLHQLYPHHDGVIEYTNQLIPGTNEFKQATDINSGFHYTYVGRLRRKSYCNLYDDYRECKGYLDYNKCPNYNNGDYTDNKCYIDQLKFISEHLDPFNKRLQGITWVPEIDMRATIVDEMKQSVPCLQRLRVENYYDKYYTLIFNWRSRDLYKAYQWNIVGLINSIDLLIKESRQRLGQSELKLGKIVEFIDSLHGYEQDWDKIANIPIDAKTISNCLFI